MLKEYKEKKTFKEIKYNYVNFGIKNFDKLCNIDIMNKEIMTSNVLDNLENYVIKIKASKQGIGDIVLYALFTSNSPIIELYRYNSIDYIFNLDFVFDISKQYNNIKDIKNTMIYCSDTMLINFASYYLDLILKSLYYIKDKITNQKVVYKQIEGNRKTNINNKSMGTTKNKKQVEVIGDLKTIYFNINNIDNKQLSLFKKSYNRHVESWFVLPHTRRLKSGKIIQVKGYIKGDKEKAINKTYVL